MKYIQHRKGNEEHLHQENGKFTISKSKSSRLSYILDETMPFDIDRFKSKMGLQYQKNSSYLTELQLDISDLPFVPNKDYQYEVSHLNICRWSQMLQ